MADAGRALDRPWSAAVPPSCRSQEEKGSDVSRALQRMKRDSSMTTSPSDARDRVKLMLWNVFTTHSYSLMWQWIRRKGIR